MHPAGFISGMYARRTLELGNLVWPGPSHVTHRRSHISYAARLLRALADRGVFMRHDLARDDRQAGRLDMA
jgi:hypothetical protein